MGRGSEEAELELKKQPRNGSARKGFQTRERLKITSLIWGAEVKRRNWNER
ncbi:MAG: hypothetical protein NC331_03310 [Lachnospiraceae bacterium]|nr:hypothetical protein [Lachnospiraceae bacterium]MCM1238395.1 hypothetical protein [Lachnospiraceae bacterium]